MDRHRGISTLGSDEGPILTNARLTRCVPSDAIGRAAMLKEIALIIDETRLPYLQRSELSGRTRLAPLTPRPMIAWLTALTLWSGRPGQARRTLLARDPLFTLRSDFSRFT